MAEPSRRRGPRPAVPVRVLTAGAPAARALGAGLLGVLLALGGTPSARAADGFTADEQLTQVVGMAADPEHGQYWVPERTTGRVQALGGDGTLRGNVRYGARPVDVQAIAYRSSRVWVGDVGDPAGNRPKVSVYRFGDLTLGGEAQYRHYTLTYPDGPHDCRAMAVSRTNRIYLATRGERPGLYRTEAEPVPGGVANKLTRVADLVPEVSDMTFSADDASLVLRSDVGLHVVDVERVAQTASAPLPAEAQGRGQALTLDLAGSGLLASGPDSPVVMAAVTQPTTQEPVTPSPTPAASAPAGGAPGDTGSALAKNRGTLWALALAGLISAAAGAVVALKR
ncbi:MULTISPECIES: hypothetical protein [unclassified Luteococcus]|uniref:hypothetical protein n=1 Tax=unclassified Luteococcus TaxID=2639923 RepID=UPI00313D305B